MEDPESVTETQRITAVVRIASITFKGGKVNFISQRGRQDEPTVSSLSDIQVYNYDYGSKTYNKIKDCAFNTGYFYSSITNLYNPGLTNLQYRLKLNSVVENDNTGAPGQNYSFDYNSIQLPPVNNFAQDVWGYYNGYTSNTSLLQAQSVMDLVSEAFRYVRLYRKLYSKAAATIGLNHNQIFTLKSNYSIDGFLCLAK